jgi:cysteinyl-tRNA synthetase
MTELRLHDTMAREKRVFTPTDPDRVTMYVCGPTVYNRAHIGNARPAVVFDVLSRLLRHVYGEDKVIYARNVTDVDDKIIESARAEGVAPEVITKRYEDFYLADMGALGVRPPDIAPHATHNIEAMVAMIARLVETGNAYEADGHVLFHVPSDPDYGALGRRDREAMIAGARVEVASYKKDPADFVLWKPSADDVIGWDSPWGRGRPGWHIECSAMIAAHLGDTIDIHGGGLDLIFPHHENEIAQSRCAHGGTPLARYWVHNGFLSMAGSEKMSKSLGNVVTVADLLEQGWSGQVIRLALLSTHYRQPLAWSDELLKASKARLDRIYFAAAYAHDEAEPDPDFVAALNDDLNFPKALSVLAKITSICLRGITEEMRGLHQTDAEQDELRHQRGVLRACARLVGLDNIGVRVPIVYYEGEEDDDSPLFRKLGLRAAARKSGMYEESDRLRSELEQLGLIVMDFPDCTVVMNVEPDFEDEQ